MKSAYFAFMAVALLGLILMLLLLLVNIDPPGWAYGLIGVLALLAGWISYDPPDRPEHYGAGLSDWL